MARARSGVPLPKAQAGMAVQDPFKGVSLIRLFSVNLSRYDFLCTSSLVQKESGQTLPSTAAGGGYSFVVVLHKGDKR
jgi:hypothetical protein